MYISTSPHLQSLGSRDRFPLPLSASAMPHKAQTSNQKEAEKAKKAKKKEKNSNEKPTWVLVKYRNASTRWKWKWRWIIRSRPAYGLPQNGLAKPISKSRQYALHEWIQTEIFIEEGLKERVSLYLHPMMSSPEFCSVQQP